MEPSLNHCFVWLRVFLFFVLLFNAFIRYKICIFLRHAIFLNGYSGIKLSQLVHCGTFGEGKVYRFSLQIFFSVLQFVSVLHNTTEPLSCAE